VFVTLRGLFVGSSGAILELSNSMMSLVGLGRNAAGRYVVLFRYYLLYSKTGGPLGPPTGGSRCALNPSRWCSWISRCTCELQYVIRLLTGNSGCNGNLLPKGHRLDSLVYSPSTSIKANPSVPAVREMSLFFTVAVCCLSFRIFGMHSGSLNGVNH
jgi:hypothetical protein